MLLIKLGEKPDSDIPTPDIVAPLLKQGLVHPWHPVFKSLTAIIWQELEVGKYDLPPRSRLEANTLVYFSFFLVF